MDERRRASSKVPLVQADLHDEDAHDGRQKQDQEELPGVRHHFQRSENKTRVFRFRARAKWREKKCN